LFWEDAWHQKNVFVVNVLMWDPLNTNIEELYPITSAKTCRLVAFTTTPNFG
jgi:hypothetical protein